MSALHPKADITDGDEHVRFVPKADMPEATTSSSSKGLTNALSGPLHGREGPSLLKYFQNDAPLTGADLFPAPWSIEENSDGLRDRHRQVLDRTEARARTPSDLFLGNRERELRPAA